ncbi:zinc-dependent alcohol dehydrogenase [Yinghuangia aomiensis]
MKIANYVSPGVIEFRNDTEPQEPASGEVLVNVKACGICGSDLHMFHNDALRDRITRRTAEGFDVPGHEFAGVIAKLGPDVTGWSVGDRVVGVAMGGMAEYVAVPVSPFQLVAIPDGVSFAAAATTEPLADALRMVRKARIKDGESIVVMGVGLIGLSVIQAIAALGIKPRSIIAIDPNLVRLQMAARIGATASIDPREGDVSARVAHALGREIEESHSGPHAGVDVVFDVAGYSSSFTRPSPLESALEMLRPTTGRIVCFGSFSDDMEIHLGYLVRKEATILGSHGYDPKELIEALQYMRDGKVDRSILISHEFPLEEIAEAYRVQSSPDAVKVMVNIEV